MTIKDVSFIVIARDEAFAIEKCLASIASMSLEECEVICADSDSTYNTLDVMKSYIGKIQNLKIVQCSGYLNASVGRNAGLRLATKRYIYYVDGDHELFPDFIAEAVDLMKSGEDDAVTGGREEIVYSDGYEQVIKRRSHRSYKKINEITHCGGWFMITRVLAEKTGEWNELIDINEDFDYVLRACRYGKMLAIPTVMCTHHTLRYHERPWKYFKNRYPMIFGMLIRKNLCRPLLLRGVLKNYRIGLAWWGLFVLSTLLTLLLGVSPWPVFAVFGLLAVLDMVWGVIRKKKLNTLLFTHYLDIPLIVLGVFVDLRREKKPTETKRIV